jgi:hypothetical protein
MLNNRRKGRVQVSSCRRGCIKFWDGILLFEKKGKNLVSIPLCWDIPKTDIINGVANSLNRMANSMNRIAKSY